MNGDAMRIQGCCLQIKNKGQVKYGTRKAASSKTIRQFKRRKESLMPTSTIATPVSSSASGAKTESGYQESEISDEESK